MKYKQQPLYKCVLNNNTAHYFTASSNDEVLRLLIEVEKDNIGYFNNCEIIKITDGLIAPE